LPASHRQPSSGIGQEVLDFLRSGAAVLGIFAEQAKDEGFDLGGQVFSKRTRRFRLVVPDGIHYGSVAIAFEWSFSGEHLVKQDAQSPKVCSLVDRLSAQLLGRHVGHGTQHHAAARERHISKLGQPEVEDFDSAVGLSNYVSRFDVPVDDPLLVGRGEPARDLPGILNPG
jgi:hypothetical protein